MNSLPKGQLFLRHNGKYHKWYHDNGSESVYIPKKNRTLAEQLALRNYLSACLQDCLREKKGIDLCLNRHFYSEASGEQMLQESSEFRELLSPYFAPLSQELQAWADAPYDRNSYPLDQHALQTVSGHLVRSKSEAMIATALYTHKIPFRYECALTLGNLTVYPDFTMRRPRNGELVYWEHFGMMDNPGYRQKAGNKINQYISQGIIPNINLITTYETLEHPLGPVEIENMIERFFP